MASPPSLKEHNAKLWCDAISKRLTEVKKTPHRKIGIMLLIDLPEKDLIRCIYSIPLSVSIGISYKKFSKLQSLFPKRKFWVWFHENAKQKIETPYEGVVFYPFIPKTHAFFLSSLRTKKAFIPDNCTFPVLPKSVAVTWGDVVVTPFDTLETEKEKYDHIRLLCDKTGYAYVTVLIQKSAQLPKIQNLIKKLTKN